MYERILVPVDGSETSLRGLDEAIRLARLTHGQIRLLHVIDELSFALAMDSYSGFSGEWLDQLRKQGAQLLQQSRERVVAAGVAVDAKLHDNLEGAVHDFVIKESRTWPADLIVIGTHGRRGLGRLVMGSSAERILRLSTVPVLLVRTPDEQRPAADPATSSEAVRVHLPSGALAFE